MEAEYAAFLVFVVFSTLLAAITLSVLRRYGRYQRRRIHAPILLVRDVLAFSGLSTTILFVTISRAIALPPEFTRTTVWIIGTSLPAILGLIVFLYFELRVIGHADDEDDGAA